MRQGRDHPVNPAAAGSTEETGTAGEAGTAGPAEATVAAGDIARLADVGKAAVSNWRRRFDDFPEPVAGTATSPRFRLAEVEGWMARHSKEFRVSAADRVWQEIRSTADDLRLGEVVGVLGAVLVLARRDPERWSALAARPDPEVPGALAGALAEAVPELPGDAPGPVEPDWVPVIRAAAALAASRGHAEVFEPICDRYTEAHTRRVPVTPPDIAALMVDLARVPDGGVPDGGVASGGGGVLDPACGTGALLLAAQAAGAPRLAGQDADLTAARITAARLLLAPPPLGFSRENPPPEGAETADFPRRVAVEVVVGDSLRGDGFGGEVAGAVVCWPPFGERSWGYDELVGDPRWQYGLPPRGEGELAWVQHCLAHARPGGGVVVAMPAAAAGRRPGRRIRGNLLRAGALRAVISLPGALAGSDLWVLRRPGADERPPSHLLLVDASAGTGSAGPAGPAGPAEAGGSAGLDGVRAAWSAFLADPDPEAVGEAEPGAAPPGSARPGRAAGPGVPSRSMRIIDLLDDEVDLSPGRHLTGVQPGRAGEPAADYPAVRAALVGACGALATLPPDLCAPPDRRDLPMSTVGELVRAGVIVVEQAPLRMVTDAGDLPVLTARDVRAGRPPSGRTSAEPGAVVLVPGDVLTPVVGREPVARVVGAAAESGAGAVLGPQVFCFRADPDRVDPAFLAGFLRVAGSTGATRASTTSSRLDARRAPIPLLGLADQRAYGEAFTRLAALHDALRETTTLADTLIHLAHTALSTGTLTPSN